MKAYRKIVKSENRKIMIEVPSDFAADQDFEVIVLPVEAESALKKNIIEFGAGMNDIIIHESFYEPLEHFKDYT